MNKKKIIKLTLLLLWMLVIFTLSSQVSKESTELTNDILGFLGADINKFFMPIRKSAHFIEYLILGMLAYLNLIEYLDKKLVIITLLFCLIYSISDEVHQLFVPGRACRVLDVVIDTAGSLTGILLTKKLVKKH